MSQTQSDYNHNINHRVQHQHQHDQSLHQNQHTTNHFINDTSVTQFDVLTGKQPTRNIKKHPGNQHFARLIHLNHQPYQNTKVRRHKRQIIRTIINIIHKQGGSFLTWNPSTTNPLRDQANNPIQAWKVLSNNISYRKVSSALKNKNNKFKNNNNNNNKQPQTSSHCPLHPPPIQESPHLHQALQAQQHAMSILPSLSLPHSAPRQPQFNVLGKGKGSRTASNLGNRLFQALITAVTPQYKTSNTNSTKRLIARSVYVAIHHTMGGRFLTPNGDTWDELTENDAIAKISQAFRDAHKAINTTPTKAKAKPKANTNAGTCTYTSINTGGSIVNIEDVGSHTSPLIINKTVSSPDDIDVFSNNNPPLHNLTIQLPILPIEPSEVEDSNLHEVATLHPNNIISSNTVDQLVSDASWLSTTDHTDDVDITHLTNDMVDGVADLDGIDTDTLIVCDGLLPAIVSESLFCDEDGEDSVGSTWLGDVVFGESMGK